MSALTDFLSVTEEEGVAATPVAEAAPTPQPPSTPQETDLWNGEIEHLAKRPWIGKLSETERKDLEAGYKNKLKNYDSGYQKKFSSLAEERKAFEATKAEADRNKKLLALYSGDEESQKVLSELEELRVYRTQAEAREAERQQVEQASMAGELEKSYGDILESEEATETMAKLLEAGISTEKAAAFVRASLTPATPPPVEESRYKKDWGDALGALSRKDNPSVTVTGTGRRDLRSLLTDAADSAEARLGRK
jgi:hypothetical protein